MKSVRIQVILAALVFSNAGVSHVYAQTCREDLINARVGMIEMREPIRLDAVSSRDALDMLRRGGDRSAVLTFQRKVDDFWRRKVERSIDPEDLTVRYQVLDGGDREGPMTHRDSDSVQFPIRLIPSRPRVLCEDSEYRIISGGFTLLARASKIGLAGLFAVEIDVDVEER